MPEPAKVVAVLVANPALGSILSMVLAAMPSLRVRTFEDEASLLTYMRLAPVDLIVCDFDSDAAPADRLARDLRADPMVALRGVQMIALAASITPEIKQVSIRAGIDEIIVKPMSPKYLLERVLSRLRRRAAVSRPAPHSSYAGTNVVPLFPRPVH